MVGKSPNVPRKKSLMNLGKSNSDGKMELQFTFNMTGKPNIQENINKITEQSEKSNSEIVEYCLHSFDYLYNITYYIQNYFRFQEKVEHLGLEVFLILFQSFQ